MIVEVEDGVVDGGCRKQNELFALTADLAASIVGRQDTLQVLVALSVAVTEVVAFIDKQNISILYIATVEFIAPKRFLRNDMGGNARAQ